MTKSKETSLSPWVMCKQAVYSFADGNVPFLDPHSKLEAVL
jgi:hypothetical protein